MQEENKFLLDKLCICVNDVKQINSINCNIIEFVSFVFMHILILLFFL